MMKICILFIVGVIFIIQEGQSRAVNISNTWTLPQDGFPVFYRYFKDKISWFEADAVCQFHHANLITVENGVQFDATRAFLKELDVVDSIWIGLMRANSNERFLWTDSRPFDALSGYWADPLPVTQTPICTVIDPVRDFRWYVQRCGGPETAAFLCQMDVPEWASDCTTNSIPSLTVQYVSDSGSVELSRDCGEQGTKHMSCKTKEECQLIINQLNCPEDDIRSSSSSSSSSSPASTGLPGTPKNTLISINIDNSIERKIDQQNFDAGDSLITDDDPRDALLGIHNKLNDLSIKGISPTEASSTTTIGSRTINKSSVLKVYPNNDKNKMKKEYFDLQCDKKLKKKSKKQQIDDRMMSDQPQQIDDNADDDVLLNDQEHITIEYNNGVNKDYLPHVKKTLILTGNDKKHDVKSIIVNSTPNPNIADPETSTDSNRNRRETTTITDIPPTTEKEYITIMENSENPTTSKSTLSQQLDLLPSTPFAIISKAKPDMEHSNDHFIPPMLLVRTKFSSTRSNVDGHGSERLPDENLSTKLYVTGSPPTTTAAAAAAIMLDTVQPTLQTEHMSDVAETLITIDNNLHTSLDDTSNTQIITTSVIDNQDKIDTVTDLSLNKLSPVDNETNSIVLATSPALITNHDQQFGSTSPTSEHFTSSPSTAEPSTTRKIGDIHTFRQPHAPFITKQSTITNDKPITSTEKSHQMPDDITTELQLITQTNTISSPTINSIDQNNGLLSTITDTTVLIDQTNDFEYTEHKLIIKNTTTSDDIESSASSSSLTSSPLTTDIHLSTLSTDEKKLDTIIFSTISSVPLTTSTSTMSSLASASASASSSSSSTILDESNETSMENDDKQHHHHADFTNAENFQPYHPNRRRILVKPESQSYVKKLFG